MGVFFWVAKISNIFFGCLKFLIFFGVNGRCWAPAYVYTKKMRVPPLGTGQPIFSKTDARSQGHSGR